MQLFSELIPETVMPEGKMKYEKVKRQLEALEKEFRVDLLPRLKKTAEGKETLLFCTSELNQFPQIRPPAEADQLFETAKQIISLRTEIFMPQDEGSKLPSSFISCCEEYNDIKNDHRRGPLKLAAYLLQLAGNEEA